VKQELHIEFCRERMEDNNKMDIGEIISLAGVHCTKLANFRTVLNLWVN
jgi:hypothetical protein